MPHALIGNGRRAAFTSFGPCGFGSDGDLAWSFTFSMLWRRSFLWTWTWLIFLLLLTLASLPGTQAAVNVSVPNTSPQIVYTPFLCNTTFLATDPDCKGAWNVSDIAGIMTVSTDGPDPGGANIVPQMFMTFHASALYMSTSAVSNATANFTVSSESNSISRVIDSAAGLVAIVNLVESELTTLSITFLPGQNATQLDIGSILMTVSDPAETTSFLPTMSLPPSETLPTFIPQSATSSTSPSASSTPRSLAHRKQIAEALGLVLGLGVGLSLIAGVIFYWWRRRRRLRAARQENAWF
ncbi:hypothetical protein C8R43DRAFT_997373 [Mycena crocata]|nr:hypothetical protein C8R43DRAFT_997373 [Mycena crocata]